MKKKKFIEKVSVNRVYKRKNRNRFNNRYSKALETEFYVVSKIFPISDDGVMGNTFLIDNHAIIDVANNTIMINESKTENDNNICFTLQPRSETVVGTNRYSR